MENKPVATRRIQALYKYWEKKSKYGRKIIGKRFGTFIVTDTPHPKSPNYKVTCDCGKKSTINLVRLLNKRPSCLECRREWLLSLLVGKSINGLTVLSRDKKNILQVECGNCQTVFPLSADRTRSWLRKRAKYCPICSDQYGRESAGRKLALQKRRYYDGVPFSEIGMFLGISRQRVEQLHKTGRLQERLKLQRSLEKNTGSNS